MEKWEKKKSYDAGRKKLMHQRKEGEVQERRYKNDVERKEERERMIKRRGRKCLCRVCVVWMRRWMLRF